MEDPMNELNAQLFYAAEHCNTALIAKALDAGANPNAEDEYGNRPAHALARYAGSEGKPILEGLTALKNAGADLNARNKADVRAFDYYFMGFVHFGRSQHHASSLPMKELQYFLDAGTDVNAPVEHGKSLLVMCGEDIQHHDIESGNLQKLGFKLDAADADGQTLAHKLAYAGNCWGLEQLLKQGVAINTLDKQGRTLLHHYALGGGRALYGVGINSEHLFEVLREQGVDFLARDTTGKTALELLKAHPRPWQGSVKNLSAALPVPTLALPEVQGSRTVPHDTNAATPVIQRILSMFEEEYHGSLDLQRGHAIGNAIRGMLQTYAVCEPAWLDAIREKAASYAGRVGAEPMLELQQKMPGYVTDKIFTDLEKTQSARAIDIALWNVARANDAAGLEQLIAAGASPRAVVGTFSVTDAAMAGYMDDEFIHGDAWPKALGALQKLGVDLRAKNAEGKDAIDLLLHELTRPMEGNSGIPPEEFINSDVITRLREVGMDVSKLEPFVHACAVPTQAPSPAAPAPAPAPHVDGGSIDAKAVPRVDDPQNKRGAA